MTQSQNSQLLTQIGIAPTIEMVSFQLTQGENPYDVVIYINDYGICHFVSWHTAFVQRNSNIGRQFNLEPVKSPEFRGFTVVRIMDVKDKEELFQRLIQLHLEGLIYLH